MIIADLAIVSVVTGSRITEVGTFLQGESETSSAPVGGWELKPWSRVVYMMMSARKRPLSTRKKMGGSAKFPETRPQTLVNSHSKQVTGGPT